MVPAPKRVDSVEVSNTTGEAVPVTVKYHDIEGNVVETKTVEVAPGGKALFDVKELDMGSWKAVAPIKSISVPGHDLEPSVGGVVKQLAVSVSGSANSLKLQQH